MCIYVRVHRRALRTLGGGNRISLYTGACASASGLEATPSD